MSVNDPELKNPENTAVPSSEEIEQQLEDIENSGKSKWRPYTMKIATVLAIVLAIAHLANAAFAGFLISYELRAMHLGGILVLTFLLYPARKKWMMSKLNFAIDILLMGGAAFSCGHLFAISRNLNKHVGNGLLIDTVCGIILFVCLIEATRRVMGWIVPTLAVLFTLYCFVGPYMPGALLHRGFTLVRTASHMYLTTEGMFSSPLGACAEYLILFSVFGAILNVSGGSQFFTDLAMSLCGKYRGGPAKVAVLGSALFGCVSGSAAANVMVTGQITIPMMKSYGYKSKYAGAVEACASSGGQLMPPVMGAAAFIMAEMIGCSYLEVCAAALVPAILYYFSLFLAADAEALRLGLSDKHLDNIPKTKDVLKEGYPFILPIAALIFFLSVMKYSAQKSVLYATVLMLIIVEARKSTRVSLKVLATAVRDGVFSAIPVALACSCAGLIIGSFSLTGLGLKLSSFLVELSGGSLMLLLFLTMLCSLILGMGMPTTAAYVVLAVLVAPAIVKMNVPPMAAHLFVLYFGVISAITPPVALAAFSASCLSGDDPMSIGFTACRLGVVAFIIPFMFVYNPSILLLGNAFAIAFNILQAIVGVVAIAYGASGYIFRKLNPVFRILLLAGGIALITEEPVSSIIGAIVIVAIFAFEFLANKKQKASVA